MTATSVLFECVKKICKKYRHLMRSDDLFREMNYVIENFSEHLLRSLVQATETVANQQLDEAGIRTAFSIINATLHIIESILGQEELPDFYEEQLPTIMQVCGFVVNKEYPTMQPPELVKA